MQKLPDVALWLEVVKLQLQIEESATLRQYCLLLKLVSFKFLLGYVSLFGYGIYTYISDIEGGEAMKPISTFIHGMMDYTMGILLILLPFLMGFEAGSAEQRVMMYSGIAIILYSIITDYELGLADMISMPAHLTLDFLGGIFLAASPWIFGFNDVVYLPHLILGALEIGAAALTERHSIRVH